MYGGDRGGGRDFCSSVLPSAVSGTVQIGPSSATSAQMPDTCLAALSDPINWYCMDFSLQSLERKTMPSLYCKVPSTHTREVSNHNNKTPREKIADLKAFEFLRVFFHFDFKNTFSYNLSKFIVLISNLFSKPVHSIKVRALDKVYENTHPSLMPKSGFLIHSVQVVWRGCHSFSSWLPQTNHAQQRNMNLDFDQGILVKI